jgi:hypothetical protein
MRFEYIDSLKNEIVFSSKFHVKSDIFIVDDKYALL